MKRTSFFPGFAWLFTSFYLFTLPGNRFPTLNWFNRLQGDKIVHLCIFAILTGLFLLPFLKYAPKKLNRTALLIAMGGILYGIAIEFIQEHYIPNRSYDIGDILADTVGSFIPFFMLAFKKRESRVT